jgi:hypothetical protein
VRCEKHLVRDFHVVGRSCTCVVTISCSSHIELPLFAVVLAMRSLSGLRPFGELFFQNVDFLFKLIRPLPFAFSSEAAINAALKTESLASRAAMRCWIDERGEVTSQLLLLALVASSPFLAAVANCGVDGSKRGARHALLRRRRTLLVGWCLERRIECVVVKLGLGIVLPIHGRLLVGHRENLHLSVGGGVEPG